MVNEVNFVRKCIATDTSQYDLWGKLVCTNFKISFITDDPMPLQKFHYKNLLLGEHDVPLTCIEQIVTGMSKIVKFKACHCTYAVHSC